MNGQSDLRLDWASFDAAKFAVENWHYSRVMPAGKLMKVGVWEKGAFKGVILYGRGANNRLAQSFGMQQTECIELVRIALTAHETTVSKLLSISLKMVQKAAPGIKVVVSYADTKQGHMGAVYQASNWTYLGVTDSQSAIDPEDGQVKHTRSLNAKYGSIKGFKMVKDLPKHRYAYALDDKIREALKAKAKPYPKKNALVV